MKFLIDENMPKEVAQFLQQHGHNAKSVAADASLRGAKDPKIMQVCDDNGYILITGDHDFMNVKEYPPQGHNGIIVLHLTSRSKPAQLVAMERLLTFMTNERKSPKGQLWIVTGRYTQPQQLLNNFTVRIYDPPQVNLPPQHGGLV